MALKVMLLAAFLGWLECDVVLSNKYWNVFQTISKLWRVWFCSLSWYTFHTFQTKAMCCSQNPFLKPITKPGLKIHLSTSKDSSKSNDLFLKGIFTDFIIEQWLTVKSTPFLSMKCKQSICQKYVSQHFQTLISTSILPTEPWVRKLKWFLRPIPYWLWLRHTACFFLETFGWHLDEGVWMPSRADYLAHTHSQSCNHLKWHRSDHWHNIWLHSLASLWTADKKLAWFF